MSFFHRTQLGPKNLEKTPFNDHQMDDNMDIINLSNHVLSNKERRLLSKGLSFCPDSNLDSFEAIKDVNLFARKVLLKSLYSKEKKKDNIVQHDKDLDDLLSLLDEQDSLDLIDTLDLDVLLQEHTTMETPPSRPIKLRNKSEKISPLQL